MFHKACKTQVTSTANAVVIIAAALVLQLGAGSVRAVDEPTLDATVIDGARAYTPTQLSAAYRDQLGRPINPSSAQAIIAQLEALYLRDGYSRPEFHLDDDRAAAGILRIEVFEAQITRVQFTGDAGPYAARLEELASDLSLQVPLRTADLQTALQAMRKLPGLAVRATTRRDESRRNAYALTVAAEYKPFSAGPRAATGTISRSRATTRACEPNSCESWK
jgi:hemolysin activation/secretion protein